jgi:rhodanese-related sulfurtransferase
VGALGYQDLSNEEAQELIESTPDLAIIDVRDEHKYAEAHVPGAELVPLQEILVDATSKLPETDILFVCNVGQMSGVAAQMAIAIGRTNVYNLAVGTQGWMADGLPVEGELAGE